MITWKWSQGERPLEDDWKDIHIAVVTGEVPGEAVGGGDYDDGGAAEQGGATAVPLGRTHYSLP